MTEKVYTKCPYCGSTRIEDHGNDDVFFYHWWFCSECGKNWGDVR